MKGILLDKHKSQILKGGGILLMLFHHLFYSEWSQSYYDDIVIHGEGLVNKIGIFSKLCVAVFVFVSGYGLAVSTPKTIKLKDFYWHRFKKLYLNYWIVWLLFVPISVLVFGRTLSTAYGDNVLLNSVLDVLGIAKIFDISSYNPTWWFYSCIIILYLIFPLLNKWLWRIPIIVVSFAFAIDLFSFVAGLNVITSYLLTFIIGMLLSRLPLHWLDYTKCWNVVLVIAILSLWRFSKTSPKFIVDTLLCLNLAIFVYLCPFNNWVGLLLKELGKHSMNMFLIHAFIFHYWFSNYIYMTRNPLLIFLSLVVSSYLLSVAIEWAKNRIGFYRLC